VGRNGIIIIFLLNIFLHSALFNSAISVTASIIAPVPIQQEDVIVVYKNQSGLDKILRKAIVVKDHFYSLKAIKVILGSEDLVLFGDHPDIKYIEYNYNQKASLMGNPTHWSIEAINASKAWEQGLTGKGVKVAVIDSGVSDHPEITVVEKHSFLEDVADSPFDESNPQDNIGHGTHILGVIGAKQNGQLINKADVIGVSPDVQLYSLKVIDGKYKRQSLDANNNPILDPNNEPVMEHANEGTVLDIIEAIDWSIDNKMDIINISLGTDTDVRLLKEAVDRAYQSGILVVSSAGNGYNESSVSYPAKYHSVIAVSSVNQNKILSSFSSTGEEIEFSAPGEFIVSTFLNNQYSIAGGTSQAAPYVTGLLSILKEKYPHLSSVELRTKLQEYTEDLGPEGRDSKYGYGFINYLAKPEPVTSEVRDLKVGKITTNSIEVSWINPIEPSFKRVHLYLNGQRVYMLPNMAEPKYTFAQLNPGTEYTIELRSVNYSGRESLGKVIKQKTREIKVNKFSPRGTSSISQVGEGSTEAAGRIGPEKARKQLDEEAEKFVNNPQNIILSEKDSIDHEYEEKVILHNNHEDFVAEKNSNPIIKEEENRNKISRISKSIEKGVEIKEVKKQENKSFLLFIFEKIVRFFLELFDLIRKAI
jgi:hypothetical protein